MEGLIDLRPTRLNCILQDLFRDPPLDHIWHPYLVIFGHISPYLAIFGIKYPIQDGAAVITDFNSYTLFSVMLVFVVVFLHVLHYESPTLILYKELRSSFFQSL